MAARGPQLFTGAQPSPRPGTRDFTQRDRVTDGAVAAASRDAADEDLPLEERTAVRAAARAANPLPKQGKLAKHALQLNVTGRMRQLIEGEIDVSDLDDEELMSGSFRDGSGKLNPGRNKVIPKSMHQEIVRRILERGQEKIRSDYFNALDTVADIMQDTDNDAAVRLRAAAMIIDRIAGKTPEKVELSVEVKPYEAIVTKIMRELPADIAAADIVDGEIVDEDDEE